jgi:hypothetical protein
VLATAPGLGPPDLCWLQKGQGAWSPGTPPGRGYYHSVLGGDVSSSAAIAGYFATLTARVEKPGLLAGLWRGAELSVQRGFYCTYDAISRTDLRCELCVPGGVVRARGPCATWRTRGWQSCVLWAADGHAKPPLSGGGPLSNERQLPTPTGVRHGGCCRQSARRQQPAAVAAGTGAWAGMHGGQGGGIAVAHLALRSAEGLPGRARAMSQTVLPRPAPQQNRIVTFMP